MYDSGGKVLPQTTIEERAAFWREEAGKRAEAERARLASIPYAVITAGEYEASTAEPGLPRCGSSPYRTRLPYES